MEKLLRRIRLFGGGLRYTKPEIEQGINNIGVDIEDMTDSQFEKLMKILPEIKKQNEQYEEEGIDISKGSTGGAVDKKRKGNKIISSKKNKKPKYAGRLAKRGYGKARK